MHRINTGLLRYRTFLHERARQSDCFLIDAEQWNSIKLATFVFRNRGKRRCVLPTPKRTCQAASHISCRSRGAKGMNVNSALSLLLERMLLFWFRAFLA